MISKERVQLPYMYLFCVCSNIIQVFEQLYTTVESSITLRESLRNLLEKVTFHRYDIFLFKQNV